MFTSHSTSTATPALLALTILCNPLPVGAGGAVDPCLVAELLAIDAAPGDQLGNSADIGDDFAVVGALDDDVAGITDAGTVRVFIRSQSGWTEHATLVSTDGASDDDFGRSVAIDGDVILLGAPMGVSSDGNRNGAPDKCGIHVVATFLDPKGFDSAATFGHAVAVEGDWIAVGAPGGDATVAGRVEMFRRIDKVWTHHSILTPLDSVLDDRFGSALAIQGDTLLVSASRATGAAPTAGAVYAFRRIDGRWGEEAKLFIAEGQALDLFGTDVALDGDLAIVGAQFRDDLGDNSGAAYVFVRSESGWRQQATLLAPDGASGDFLGVSVELDDGIVALGAAGDDGGISAIAGSVRIFELLDETWVQTASISPLDGLYPDAVGAFGSLLALRDGTLVVNASISFTPSCLVYDETVASWSQPRLLTSPSGVVGPRAFMLRADGQVGAWVGADEASGTVISVIWRDGAGWTTEQVVAPPVPVDAAAGAGSRSVGFDDATLLSAEPFEFGDGEPESFMTIPIDPVEVGPIGTSFFVGLFMKTDGEAFAGSEAQVPHRQASWIVVSGTGLELGDLTANPPAPWDFVAVVGDGSGPSVLALRANLSDCDASNRLDSCEIVDGTLEDLNGDGVPDTCEPVAGGFDLDGDGVVAGGDMSVLLAAWGPCPVPLSTCPGDLDKDGGVGASDLGLLLAAWSK